MAKEKHNGNIICDRLNMLEAQGIIPFYLRAAKTRQHRWQRSNYPSGVHYAAPTNPTEMGRYNDPTGQSGICYTADFAVAAIAESLGRLYHQKPQEFILGLSQLQSAHLYSLETTRTTKTIDMVRLQALLHLTADQTMGADYSLTQAVTAWAANTAGLNYDGISYPSRHYGVGMCTAWWKGEGGNDPLTDIARSPVDRYIDTAVENFPQNWTDADISGFEIIAFTLQFSVSSEK